MHPAGGGTRGAPAPPCAVRASPCVCPCTWYADTTTNHQPCAQTLETQPTPLFTLYSKHTCCWGYPQCCMTSTRNHKVHTPHILYNKNPDPNTLPPLSKSPQAPSRTCHQFNGFGFMSARQKQPATRIPNTQECAKGAYLRRGRRVGDADGARATGLGPRDMLARLAAELWHLKVRGDAVNASMSLESIMHTWTSVHANNR